MMVRMLHISLNCLLVMNGKELKLVLAPGTQT